MKSNRWNARCELTLTNLSICFTIIVGLGGIGHFCWLLLLAREPFTIIEIASFSAAGIGLLYGNIVFQLTRAGALRRDIAARPISRQRIERVYDAPSPVLAILIPSYKEEPAILRQTVLSAALVEYPGRRVVVLIDDPVVDVENGRARSWAVVRQMRDCFARARMPFERAESGFESRRSSGPIDLEAEASRLASLYEAAAGMIESIARDLEPSGSGHTDQFFRSRILLQPACAHRERAGDLRNRVLADSDIVHEYRRLAELFRVDVDGFERKEWVNLSHEPNKAMNLNAYIGLLGRNLRIADTAHGRALVDAGSGFKADLAVPDCDYLLTLDADSLIDADYMLRLMQVMQGDDRVAVVQTPYSAVPGAPGLVERIAGATTDIQYISHQGFTHYGATYWVGANALLRLAALRDIRMETSERGHRIPVFIQHRTVIEDTGSTIDLIRKGWKLHNHPERLAYSATPPDFGSLVIQRRRWANGGLIILPDLIRFSWQGHRRPIGFLEIAVRAHYLVSPALGSICVLVLLLSPFDPMLAGIWLPIGAVPYYCLYGRDLVRSGYGWLDLLRVYAMNLLLIPVNLGGVLRSLQQIATGIKAPFGRTPKVADRTAVQPVYIISTGLLALSLCFGSFWDLLGGEYARAAFGSINAVFLLYGFHRYMGLRESWFDLKSARTRWLRADRIGIGGGALARLRLRRQDVAQMRLEPAE